MSQSTEVVCRGARDILLQYLEVFPEDRSRLEEAVAQLAELDGSVLARSTMRGHITTSAMVVDPRTWKVLMIHHRIYDEWYPPGGHYEVPGDLWDSAAREVFEETGVQPVAYRWVAAAEIPLDVDTHPIPANPAKGEGAHAHHDFTFVAVADSTIPLVPQDEEVFGAAWVPVETLLGHAELRCRRLARRVIALLER